MQEYIVASFLSKPRNKTFKKSAWPLHVTILGIFKSDLSQYDIEIVLEKICKKTKPLILQGETRSIFGIDNNIPVTELQHKDALHELHSDLLATLEESIHLRTPQFTAQNYRPHVTDQSHTEMVKRGETISIRTLSLVQLEGELRHILSTFTMSLNFLY
ncbi:MAG TPA: 2'-5' RNA ligase family protein [Candidatus Paceibacterota bacterium]